MRILYFVLIVLIIGFTKVSAQKGAKQNTSLKTVVSQYAAKNIKYLNRFGGMDRYAVKAKNTFYSDVDSDGDFDALVEIIFCEYSNCHPTTQSSKLAVFLNSGNSYRFAVDREFTLFGKINSIKENKIKIDVYTLDEGDPQCCPELKRSETYQYKQNKLVKIKNK
jgi:hypothetical protein